MKRKKTSESYAPVHPSPSRNHQSVPKICLNFALNPPLSFGHFLAFIPQPKSFDDKDSKI